MQYKKKKKVEAIKIKTTKVIKAFQVDELQHSFDQRKTQMIYYLKHGKEYMERDNCQICNNYEHIFFKLQILLFNSHTSDFIYKET